MTTQQILSLVVSTINALTVAMQNGKVDPIKTNALLTQLTYVKMELEDQKL